MNIKLTLVTFLLLLNKLSFSQDRLVKKALYDTYRSAAVGHQNLTDSLKYFIIELKESGKINYQKFKPVKRLTNNIYIVSTAKSIVDDDNLISVAEANSFWKAADNLVELWRKHPASNKVLKLKILMNAPSSGNLRQYGTIAAQSDGAVSLITTYRQLPGILNLREVIFANTIRKPHTELVINDIDLGANSISAIAGNYPGVNGDGINVSVKENLYDISDIDLVGRSFVSVTPSATLSQHATTMATLIGGSGISFIKGTGAAPGVKFTSSDFAQLLPDTTSVLVLNNISVQNHSYGTGIENYYSDESLAYDQQIADDNTLVHVFSSGNVGTSAPGAGVYNGITGFANITGTFKQAKNVIVVGGTDRGNMIESLSSAGPAYDGRIVPQIVADGEDGTSGAAALVSGTVALLQQAYKIQFNRLPPNALIKSVLINSADKIDASAVSFKAGYGKLNALEALRTISDGRFNEGAVSNSQQLNYTVTVPAETGSLKVSLAWDDVAAQINAPAALVNDLDLTVTNPAGAVILPWTLSSYPSADSLAKPSKQQKDSLNNTEQVIIANPAAGSYIVHVKGSKIPNGLQTFYVTRQMVAANKFEWVFPSGMDHVITADSTYLRWQNSYTASTGQLSISYDHGTTWQLISNTALKNNYYEWLPPDAFTTAMLKMDINGLPQVSKEFVISKPISPQVGYNCTSGTLLHWKPQTGSTRYAIYNIKDNLLQKIMTVIDTSVIIPSQQQSSVYFAVSALGNGFEGVKSYTINVADQGVGCYVRTLLANVTDKNIKLELELGSVEGLKSVTWQKLTGNGLYIDLGATAISGTGLTLQFTDVNPKNGIQYYRARLTTNDNSVIYSDQASVIFLQPSQFAVFPNPVTDVVNILSGDINAYEFKLFNAEGKLSVDQSLNDLNNTIPINLNPGVYPYEIIFKGKVIFSGKLVKI